jgi:hypothetical protein
MEETKELKYVGGYKYQSRNDMHIKTIITPPIDIVTDLIILRSNGWLTIKKYFAWDGCSGPTIDDVTNMRAGQVHDALYALMRMELLDLKWRAYADQLLYCRMISDGASTLRAKLYRFAVNRFAKYAAMPNGSKDIKIAPIRR